jgi:hypothetical protein
LKSGWKVRNLHYGLEPSEHRRTFSDAAAETDLRPFHPSRTRSESFESIYGIDNNRESATSPCGETSGTRCLRTTLRSRGYARVASIRARWNQIQSSVLLMCSDHRALRRPVDSAVSRTGCAESNTKLKETARVKFRHSARKPAFNPPRGSWLLRINKAAQPTPATSPVKTPAMVTRFQKMPSTTPGRNCVTPAYPSNSKDTKDNEL